MRYDWNYVLLCTEVQLEMLKILGFRVFLPRMYSFAEHTKVRGNLQIGREKLIRSQYEASDSHEPCTALQDSLQKINQCCDSRWRF